MLELAKDTEAWSSMSFVPKIRIYLLLGAFICLSLYVALKLDIFLIKESAYSFRSDNFWSYSSGIIRRGLNGEIIYLLDFYTRIGPYLFACMIWICFVYFLFYFVREIYKELNLFETLLFLISPLFLLYFVDAEIFTLIPFISLFHKNENVAVWGTLILIIVATLLREISLLFFFPVLIYFISYKNKAISITAVITLIMLLALLLFPKPEPNYFLENTYWNDKGFELLSTNLYHFTSMPITDVLKLHISYIKAGLEYIIVPVVTFILFATTVFYKRTKSPLGSTYLFIMISTCFILTIDYGRYFYLFIFFVFLASDKRIAHLFTTFPANFPKSYSKFFDLIFTWFDKKRVMLLGLLVIAPSGYWIGDYGIAPRFYTFLTKSDFLVAIYRGLIS